MPTPKLQERRVAERLPYSGKIAVAWAEGAFQAYSADLSEAGVFLEASDSLPLGTKVRLEFTISEAAQRQNVKAEGFIVRRVTIEEASARGLLPGLGIAFERVAEGERVLRRFMGGLLTAIHAPQAPAFEEERKHARTLVALPVSWGTDRNLGREGYLRSLSTSGTFLETKTPEPRGTHLYLGFELPHKGIARSVKLTAVVAYVQPSGRHMGSGMGLAWESSTAEISSIDRFVDSRL